MKQDDDLDDNIGQGLRLSPSIESMLEDMIKGKGLNGLIRADHMLKNFESQGYDTKVIRQVYDTYALEYKKKERRF